MINILIADDHKLMREGLRRILHGIPDIKVVGLACDAATTLAAVTGIRADVLLLDLSMPGLQNIELIVQVRQQAAHIKILVLTMHDENSYAVPAIRAGAMGFLTKERTCSRVLLEAIRNVAAGRPVVSATAAKLLAMQLMSPAADASSFSRLSAREREVFMMLVGGDTLTRIGHRLGLSIKTISTFKTRIEEKMDMSGISELVQYAIRHELITPKPMPSAGTRIGALTAWDPSGMGTTRTAGKNFIERRRCRLTESKVDVALVLLDMLGGDDAAKYLASARVPREVAARVITYPKQCRNAHRASLKSELSEH